MARSRVVVAKVEVEGAVHRNMEVGSVVRSKVEVEDLGSSSSIKREAAINQDTVPTMESRILEMRLLATMPPEASRMDHSSRRKVRISTRTANHLCLIYRPGRLSIRTLLNPKRIMVTVTTKGDHSRPHKSQDCHLQRLRPAHMLDISANWTHYDPHLKSDPKQGRRLRQQSQASAHLYYQQNIRTTYRRSLQAFQSFLRTLSA